LEEPKTSALGKVAHFFMPEYFPLNEKDKPELVMTPEGKMKVNIPDTARVSFLEDPVTTVAFGAVGGAKAAGPIARKAAVGAREFAGWLSGGASEVSALATRLGLKGAKKAAAKLEEYPEKKVEKAVQEYKESIAAKKGGEKVIGARTKESLRSISSSISEVLSIVKLPSELKSGIKSATAVMTAHHRNIRKAESTSQLLKKIVNDAVPDPERQMLMVHAFEHDMKGPYWEQLTSVEKDIVKQLAKEKDKIERYIEHHGLLDLMETGEGTRHLFHWWINPETGKPYSAMYGRYSKNLPQAKTRKSLHMKKE